MKGIGVVRGALTTGNTVEDFRHALQHFYERINPWEKNPISFEVVARDETGDESRVRIVSVRDISWSELMHLRRDLEDFCGAAIAFRLVQPGIRFTLDDWGDSEDFT